VAAAAAVVLALLVGSNEANVSVFWAPYRIDLSLNLFMLLVLVVFVLLYGLARSIAVVRGLPQQAQRWRLLQLERSAQTSLLDALAYQLSGRFVRAQASAEHALVQLRQLEHHPVPGYHQACVLAYYLAAESTQALGNLERRDEHLQAALDSAHVTHATEAKDGLLLRAATWALDQRDPSTAEAWLSDLPQGVARRIQAQRLKLRLARLQGDHGAAIDLVRVLTKHRAYTPQASASLLRGLVLDAVRGTRDRSHLVRLWRSLMEAERAMPEIAIAVLEQWGALAAADEPVAGEHIFLQDCLESAWAGYADLGSANRRRLLLQMEAALPQLTVSWLAQIEQAQQRQPNDPGLQYLAGQAFMQRQLWGKAAFLLGQASTRLEDPELARRTWRSLARLAEERGDTAAAQQAWKHAALL